MKKVLWLAGISVLIYSFFILVSRIFGGETIDVVHPKIDMAVQAVYATGTVEPTVMFPIASRSTARLMELFVDEGSEIKKGQVLARLEDTDIQQSIKELLARQELAQNNFERAKGLIKQNAISKGEYDLANTNLMAAKALVAGSEAQLSYLTLRAPEDGKIIRRDGEIGQLISSNQTVFWMSCCAPLRITAEVDEEDIALVKPQQKVLISADAFPGKVFDGQVLSITPKGDPIARSYRVRIGFSDKTPLLIGMTAETNIIIREKKDALLLPGTAIKENKVWLIKDSKVAIIDVETGAINADLVEIINGISKEDLIILNPSSMLKDGQKIRAKLISRAE